MTLRVWPSAVPLDPDARVLPAPLAATLASAGAVAPVILLVAGPQARESGWAAGAAVALAETWARDGARVVLADLDLARPSLHLLVGEANDEGLADVFLYGNSLKRIMRGAATRSFGFVPAGESPAGSREVLTDPGWRQVVAHFFRDGAVLLVYLGSDADGLEALARRLGAVIALATPRDVPVLDGILPGDAAVLALLEPPGAAGAGEEAAAEPPLAEPWADQPDATTRPQGDAADAAAVPFDVPPELTTPEWLHGPELEPEPEAEPWAAGPSEPEPQPEPEPEPGIEPWAASEPELARDAEPSPEPQPQPDFEPWAAPEPEIVPEPEVAPGPEVAREEPESARAPEVDLEELKFGPSLEARAEAEAAEAEAEAAEAEAAQAGSAEAGSARPGPGPEPQPEPAVAVPEQAHDRLEFHLTPGGGTRRSTDPKDALVEALWARRQGGHAGPPAVDPVAGRKATEEELLREPPALEPESPRRRVGLALLLWLALGVAVGLGLYLAVNYYLTGSVPFLTQRQAPARLAAPAQPGPAAGALAPRGALDQATPGSLGDSLPFSVAIEAYPEYAPAVERAQMLARDESGIGFFVTPILARGSIYYQVMAGPVADSVTAVALMQRLLDAGVKTGGSFLDIVATRLAFALGDYSSRGLAEKRGAELAGKNIPTYVVELPLPGGPPRWRVYAGAFQGAADAAVLRPVLKNAGIQDSLVLRTGIAPR